MSEPKKTYGNFKDKVNTAYVAENMEFKAGVHHDPGLQTFDGSFGNLNFGSNNAGSMTTTFDKPAPYAGSGSVPKKDDAGKHFKGQLGNLNFGENNTGSMKTAFNESDPNAAPGSVQREEDQRKPQQDTTDGTADTSVSDFGHSDTAAILIAGTGPHSDIFRKNTGRMKNLLSSEYVGVDESKIFEVIPRKQETKLAIGEAIKGVIEELKDAPTGNFILFYSGHFNTRALKIDDKGNQEKDFYTDKILADDLKKIPAKNMLFIMEMCYSGCADVGAMDDDEDSEYIEQEMPRLWEFFDTSVGAMSPGESRSTGSPCVVEKVVHWASSKPEEKSWVDKPNKTGFFSNAINEVIEGGRARFTKLPPGQTHVTVLRLNEHVTEHVQNALRAYNKTQTPTIYPQDAKEEYFKAFPAFAKLP